MHIVLSGYYGFDNVGDEAILFSIIRAMRALDPEIKITVLSNNPVPTEKTYDVEAVNRWKFKEIAQVLKEADGLISGGGSLLQDKTGPRSIPYYTGIMRIAKFYRKPVFVYAQGMGPINRGFSKWLTKNTLNKVDRITIRDEDSKQLLAHIGVKLPLEIVPDPVLGLDASDFETDWVRENALAASRFVSVSVRDWPSTIAFKEQIAASLDLLAKDGYAIVFLPMHGKDDDEASQSVAKLMQKRALVAPYDGSIEEKIAIIGASDLLVGMRLHSLIFAAITHTPFVALSYDPKIDAFAKIVEQPVAGNVTSSDWNSSSLYQAVVRGLADDTAKEKMVEKVTGYQEQALETAKMAYELFGN